MGGNTGFVVEPDVQVTSTHDMPGSASVAIEGKLSYQAATVLVEHLFAQASYKIPGIDYGIGYKLAEGHTGGDIVDVYHFDNDSVALSIADISGKGIKAAVHAAMVKYGVRAYASHGLTAERTVRAMDRLFLENNAFEQTESFASLFFGHVDPRRKYMTYANAGHEPIVIVRPDGSWKVLEPTAPLLGIFDDQHHLFKEAHIDVSPGTVLIATTDGVTEARSAEGDFFGMEGFVAAARRYALEPVDTIVEAILLETLAFCGNNLRDDVAILVTRFL